MAVARLRIVRAVMIVHVTHTTASRCISIVCGVFFLMVFIYWRSIHIRSISIGRCECEWMTLIIITSYIFRSSITDAPWTARTLRLIIDFSIVVATLRGARSFARVR